MDGGPLLSVECLNLTTGQWKEVREDYGENDYYKVLVVGTRDGHRKGEYFRDCLAGEDLRHGQTRSLWRGLHQLTWKTN